MLCNIDIMDLLEKVVMFKMILIGRPEVYYSPVIYFIWNYFDHSIFSQSSCGISNAALTYN